MCVRQVNVAAVKRVMVSLIGGLLLAAIFLIFVPHSQGAPLLQAVAGLPTVPPEDLEIQPFTQTLSMGGQEIAYTGDHPLPIESGTYWDTPPVSAQAIVAVDSDGPHLHLVPGSDDQVHLIVQLEGAPLAADPPGLKQRAANLRANQEHVLQAWASQGLTVRTRQRYLHAFNGLAIVASAGDRATIAQTPGVRAVYPDYALQPLLSQSVPLVGAPEVWTMQDAGDRPVMGTKVRVGVIDTGVDYDHPNLGGPGFPNTRIITGYNFVSDTVDPRDDMGHGTYVAGIVGASGQITGVAPAVSLMAYKVVDAQLGYAHTSDTMAAIEHALDPDGDPGTADGAAVINISLGSPGVPNDPLSQACNHAVNAGAVVVIGAGNSGPTYHSLTSPGMAEQAISVGATNKSDSLWPYSSRGPIPSTWAIKPDLVAPGVSISSTAPGGYTYGTGTSASTPHVAGAAALLRQLHPTWSPAWIKAALMNTARDLGRSPFEQGAGRLQVDQAAATPALLLPPSLSLGRVDGTQSVWSRQETLTLTNVSTTTVTYTLSITGSFPTGIDLIVSPTQVIIDPLSTTPLTLTVAVETALVPDRTTEPFAYWGTLRALPAAPAAPNLHAPFAFIKAPLLRLHVDEVPVSVMFIHDEPLTSRYAWPVTTTSHHQLPSAAYSVAVQYQQPYAYVVQGVTLTDSQFVALTMPRSAAVHQARIAFTDESGETATPNHALHRFMWDGNGWLVSELAGAGPISEVVRFSDVPPQFTWERTVADADPAGDAYRQWHGRAEGISGDLAFLTAPDDLAQVEHPLRPQPGAGAYSVYEMLGYERPSYALTFGPAATLITPPYERQAYYRAPPPGHELHTLRLVMPEPAPDDSKGVLMSPWLQLDAEDYLRWRQPLSPAAYYWRVPAGGVEPLGLGPAHSFARFDNDAPDTIRLVAAEGESLFFRAYQGGDVSWEQRQPYELRQGGTLVQTGDLGASTGDSQALITLPTPGIYSLTLPFTYTLGNSGRVTGHGRAVATFDTTRYATDANPPFVKVLRLIGSTVWSPATAGNQPTDAASGPVEIHLAISDTVDVAPVVSVAYDVGTGWVPVPVTQIGDEYVTTSLRAILLRATLPHFADGTAVNVRILAVDASGNELVHVLEPAYLVRWQRVYLPLVFKGVSLP